jgi:hypothetical protein
MPCGVDEAQPTRILFGTTAHDCAGTVTPFWLTVTQRVPRLAPGS